MGFLTSPLVTLESLLTKGNGLWWAVFVTGSGLMAAALYWQYVVGDDPCQVCIQARLWAVSMGLVGALMLSIPDTLLTRLSGLALTFMTSAGMGERAYYLYEIENFRGRWQLRVHLGHAAMVCGGSMVSCTFRGPEHLLLHTGNCLWHQHGRGAYWHRMCCLWVGFAGAGPSSESQSLALCR